MTQYVITIDKVHLLEAETLPEALHYYQNKTTKKLKNYKTNKRVEAATK